MLPASSPPARADHAMVYDSRRGCVVLFGGRFDSFGSLGDTWEWNGLDWVQRTPATNPPARYAHAMAYDSARGVSVLFGGQWGSDDTWEWDGTDWTQLLPALRPSLRTDHGMAYDAARQRTVLWGGSDRSSTLWEWDGTVWTSHGAFGPAWRFDPAMTYDSARQRVVMFGGASYSESYGDTWEWDGTGWTQRQLSGPPPKCGHAIAYDAARGRTVWFAGETWEYDGQAWTRPLGWSSGPLRAGHGMAYDSARAVFVVFGGVSCGPRPNGDVAEWDGVSWVRRSVANGPFSRYSHSLAYDSGRGRTVLYGGYVSWMGSSLSDTWEWDGSQWHRYDLTTTPGSRSAYALAYDPVRGVTVLHGGSSNSLSTDDTTWEWDGTAWTERFPATVPPARRDHAMAYDAGRQRMVMFGGAYAAGDTWEWNGTDWTQRFPATSPPGREDHAMAYDAARGRVVLFGGQDRTAGVVFGDTWEWDGTHWAERFPVSSPGVRQGHTMACDKVRRVVVLYGGSTQFFASGSSSDTWVYDTHPDVFPEIALADEGNTGLSYPFSFAQSRVQVLMEADGFGGQKRSGAIAALEMRRDQGVGVFASRDVDLRLSIGPSGTTAETMSTEFLANWQGTPTLAFLGPLSLPQQPPAPTGPASFGVRIPFANPFVWAGEDLLYEVDSRNNTVTGIGTFDLDAVVQPPPFGVAVPIGAGCAGPNGTPVYPTPDPSRIVVGGTILNDLRNATLGTLAVHLLGDSTAQWGALPLPVTWPGSSCTIYTSVALSAYAVTGAAGTAQVSWPIPNSSAFAGAIVHGQWGVVEGPTVYPPLTMTGAHSFVVGARSPMLFESIANSSGASSGSKSTLGNVTLVTRLVFQ